MVGLLQRRIRIINGFNLTVKLLIAHLSGQLLGVLPAFMVMHVPLVRPYEGRESDVIDPSNHAVPLSTWIPNRLVESSSSGMSACQGTGTCSLLPMIW